MKTYHFLFLVLLGAVSCKTSKPNRWQASKSIATSSSGILQDSAKKVTDTAGLVKNIVAQKSKYLDKQLGVLLKDLDIPVKSYTIINSRYDQIDGITISFDDRKTTQSKQDQDDLSKKPALLHVIWATPVPAATYNELRKKSMANGNWNSVEEEFYAKQIVKDIQ